MSNKNKLKKVMNDDFDKKTNYNQIIKRIDKSRRFHCQFKYAFVSVIALLFIVGIFNIGNSQNEEINRVFSSTVTNEASTSIINNDKTLSKDDSDKGLPTDSSFGLNSLVVLYYEGDIKIYTQGLDEVNITIDNESFDLKRYLKNSKTSTSKALDDIVRMLKKDNNYNDLYFEVFHDESNITIVKCKRAKKVYIGDDKMLIRENVCN